MEPLIWTERNCRNCIFYTLIYNGEFARDGHCTCNPVTGQKWKIEKFRTKDTGFTHSPHPPTDDKTKCGQHKTFQEYMEEKRCE